MEAAANGSGIIKREKDVALVWCNPPHGSTYRCVWNRGCGSRSRGQSSYLACTCSWCVHLNFFGVIFYGLRLNHALLNNRERVLAWGDRGRERIIGCICDHMVRDKR